MHLVWLLQALVIITALVFAIGVSVIGLFWYTGHPSVIDRGDGPGNKRAIWNPHSKFHIYGAAITAFPAALFDGPYHGFFVSLLLWTLVEVAQKYPRDKQGGMIELADLWWDAVGALGGAWLGAFIGQVLL